MRPRDFCYWLQGAIEICAPDSFNSNQIEQIRQHLNMVDECVKGLKRRRNPVIPHYGFCTSLRAIIADQTTLTPGEMITVKKLLNAEFIHIDADTEGDQDAMSHLHGGDGNARC